MTLLGTGRGAAQRLWQLRIPLSRIDHGGRSDMISDDTRPSESLASASTDVDVLVHEAITAPTPLLAQSETARRIVGFHTLPADTCRIFARVRSRLAVHSHVVLLTTDIAIPAPTAAELQSRKRTTYDRPLEVGKDLMTIDIGREIGVRRCAPPGPSRP